MKNKKINKSLIDITAIVLPAILTVLTIYFIILLSKYSAISSRVVILASVALASIILLIDLCGAYGFYFKKKIFQFVTIGVAAIAIVAAGFGSYYLWNMNNSIDQIIVSGGEEESVTVAFVTYDNDEITSADDMDSSTIFGYIDNESFQAGNVLALEELDNLNSDVQLEGYDTYSDLILALFNKDVDVAALPENYYEMFAINDGYEDYLDKTQIIHTYTKTIKSDDVETVTKDITSEPFSVLLMGVDEGRTDTLMVLTFNPQSMTVTMTSIARDSFVPIACYNNESSDKINAARTVSRNCTIQTVENLLGIDIDFFIEVNFQGVVDIVDALGGLWLTSPIEFVGQNSSYERGNYTVWVNEGYQLMDGEQVLAFARERHNMPNGDFDRQENQQQILTALATALLDMDNASEALQVIEAAGTNISTNFSLSQMSELLNFGIDKLNNTYVGERNGTSIFNIISTRIYGYSSWTYNDSLQLPLWIYKLYEGSIEDNLAIIERNLETDTTLKAYYETDFDVSSPYYAPTSYVPETYDEQEVHEVLPDFMKNMVKNDWTLEDVYEWKADNSDYDRSHVTIVAHEVTATNEYSYLYSDSYSYHQIVKQSVDYGVKISNISTLEVWYIMKDIDCSVETYRDDSTYSDQCGVNKIVPNFVEMTKSEVETWKANHTNITVNITTLTDSDANYNVNYVGKISSQSSSQYTKWSDINYTITLTYCDYPHVILDIDTLSTYTSASDIKAWFSSNWYVTPTYTSGYSDTVPAGQIISVKNTSDGTEYTENTSLKGNVGLTVKISSGNTVTVPDFNGKTYAEYEEFMESIGLTAKASTNSTVESAELAGLIYSQTVDPGTGVPYATVRTLSVTLYIAPASSGDGDSGD